MDDVENRTHPPGMFSGISSWFSDHIDPISASEINSLVKYASERGIDEDGLLKSISDELFRHENPGLESAERINATGQLLTLYTRLCSLTDGVTGKSIVEGRDRHRHLILLYVVTLFMLTMGLYVEAMTNWLLDQPAPEDPVAFVGAWTVSDLHEYLLSILGPFFWGGLGACIYLMKRISDEVQAFRFDLDRYPGWQTRVLLGFVLGGTVAYLFEPMLDDSGEGIYELDTVMPNVIAFLTGLGTKVVYGALEKLVEVLADKLNLESVRRRKRKVSEEVALIADELQNTDPKSDPERYELLIQLLQSRKET